jgi:hypothetical protein
MFDKIKSIPWTVMASMLFLLALLVVLLIIEPVVMGGFIFVVLVMLSIGRVFKYLAEGK